MHDYVFGLDVPVDDLVGVEFIDGLADLPDDAGDLVLGHRLVLLELLEELPAHRSL